MTPSPNAGQLLPPAHVAIIMDGNGRWAKARGLPRIAGHQRGVDALRVVVEASREIGIDYLTLYAFSEENWSRAPMEVAALMTLLEEYVKKEYTYGGMPEEVLDEDGADNIEESDIQ